MAEEVIIEGTPRFDQVFPLDFIPEMQRRLSEKAPDRNILVFADPKDGRIFARDIDAGTETDIGRLANAEEGVPESLLPPEVLRTIYPPEVAPPTKKPPSGDTQATIEGAPLPPDTTPAPTTNDILDFAKRFGDAFIHGSRTIAGGALSVANLPFSLAEPIEKLIEAGTGTDIGVVQGHNKRIKELKEDIVGKAEKDYNIADNINDFGGGLIPVPGLAAQKGVRALGELLTPLIPAKKLNTTTMVGNVALPLAALEGFKAIAGEDQERASTPRLAPELAKDAVEEIDRLKQAAEWSAVLGVGAVAALRGRTNLADIIQQTPNLPPARQSIATTLKTQLVDKNAPVTDALAKVGADRVITRTQTTASGQALGSKTEATMMSGLLPETSILTNVRPAGWIEEFGRLERTNPKMAGDLDKLLRIRDDLDSRAAGQGTAFHGVSDAALRAEELKLASNPALSRMAAHQQDLMKKLLDYMEKRGFISKETHAEISKTHPNYLPRIEAVQGDQKASREWFSKGLWNALASNDPVRGKHAIQQLLERSNASLPREQLLDAKTSVAVAYESAIRAVETNALRRQVVDALYGQKDRNGHLIVEKVKEFSPEVVTIIRNGKHEYYKVADPVMRQALEFAPNTVNAVNAAARNAFQRLTTGNIAEMWNVLASGGVPIQTIKTLMWDTPLAIAARPKGTSFGILEAMRALPQGVLDGIYEKTLRNLLAATDKMVMSDFFSGAVSPATAKRWNDKLREMWATSTIGMFKRHGGAGGHTIDLADYDNLRTMMANYAPLSYHNSIRAGTLSSGARTLFNQWTWLHETLNQSLRHGFMDVNLPKPKNFAELTARWREIEDIANKTARLTADYRARGRSPITGSVLYANPAIQEFAKITEVMKKNPTRLIGTYASVALAGFGLMLSQFDEHPELAKYFFDNHSDVLARGIPIFLDPTNPDSMAVVEVTHSMGAFAAPAITFLASIFGLTDGTYWSASSLRDAVRGYFDLGEAEQRRITNAAEGAAKRAAIPIGGPITRAATSATGLSLEPDRFLEKEGRSRLDPTKKGIYDPTDAWVRNIVEDTTGLIGAEMYALYSAVDAAVSSGKSIPSGMEKGIDAAQIRARSRATQATGLLGEAKRPSTLTPEADIVRDKLKKITDAENYMRHTRETDFLGQSIRTGISLPFKDERAPLSIGSNLAAQQVWALTREPRMKEIEQLRSRRSDLYAARERLAGQSMNAREKVNHEKQLNRDINLTNRLLLQSLYRLELDVGIRLRNPQWRLEDLRLDSSPPAATPP